MTGCCNGFNQDKEIYINIEMSGANVLHGDSRLLHHTRMGPAIVGHVAILINFRQSEYLQNLQCANPLQWTIDACNLLEERDAERVKYAYRIR